MNVRAAADLDVAVIGGGVIGAAVTAALAAEGRSVALLEAERRFGTGVTSRNSGVVHSGLYYPPTSLKARLCVEGNALLYAWCEARAVPVQKLGKLVVARRDDEGELHALLENARESGARGLSLLDARATEEREPSMKGALALFCAETGIVDPHALTESLRVAAESDGALVLPGARLLGVDAGGAALRLETARGPLTAERVVNASALHADDVARLFGHTATTVYPWRGDYFRWKTRRRFRHLVYPVKKRGAAGLGVHLTIGLDGTYRLGPDVEPAKAKDDFAPADHKEPLFRRAAERLFGRLDEGDELVWDGCGIRPKLRAPGETAERDFVVEEEPKGVWHLFGIESPGLTASLALGRYVARLMG